MPRARILSLSALAALVALTLLASCSSDGGGDKEAFCDTLQEMESVEDPTNEEALGLVDQLQEEAPSEIRDDVDTMAGFFDDISGLDEEDPEAFAEVLALAENDEFTEAADNLEAYASDECGLTTDTTG